MAAATAPQMTLRMTTTVLAIRADASAARLEAGVQLHVMADPVPGQREARLVAAMEVEEAWEADMFPVPALVEARPVSVRVAHLVQALV